MIATADIAWAAGFLEGEGHFCRTESGIMVSQIEREPLEWFQRLFGGNIRVRPPKPGHKGHHVWSIHGSNAAAAMMTLWSFMCPKRKGQIEFSLSVWRAAKHKRVSRDAPYCPNGHKRSVFAHSKATGCAECRRIEDMLFMRAKRAATKEGTI